MRRLTAGSQNPDLDPSLARTYTSPGSGVGAHYAWKGNRKAGEGLARLKATAEAP